MSTAMKLHHTAAFACCYVLGWAFVLAGVMMGGGKEGYTLIVLLNYPNNVDAFINAAILAWICYTVPCILTALALFLMERRHAAEA
jgi:hypothetical protein